MSNSHLTALGLPVDTRVSRSSIVPGTESGFSIPTAEAPAKDVAAETPAPASRMQPGALVASQVVQQRAPAAEAQTLGQRYDEEAKKGGLDRYASLFGSYFPT